MDKVAIYVAKLPYGPVTWRQLVSHQPNSRMLKEPLAQLEKGVLSPHSRCVATTLMFGRRSILKIK